MSETKKVDWNTPIKQVMLKLVSQYPMTKQIVSYLDGVGPYTGEMMAREIENETDLAAQYCSGILRFCADSLARQARNRSEMTPEEIAQAKARQEAKAQESTS